MCMLLQILSNIIIRAEIVVCWCFIGSVYELSGSEVCLSTGDLLKVIDIELLSVSCEDTSNNDKFELPINHAGEAYGFQQMRLARPRKNKINASGPPSTDDWLDQEWQF